MTQSCMTILQVRHALKIAVIGYGAIGSFVVEHLIGEPALDVVGMLSEPPPASTPKFGCSTALMRCSGPSRMWWWNARAIGP